MSLLEVAELIERFLEGRSLYPQEWNDFIDTSQRDSIVNAYRKRCNELDPLVNRPEPPDEEVVLELQTMVKELREQPHVGNAGK